MNLLETDRSASFFEFLLCFVRSVFANTGKNLRTSSFSHSLGFAETEAGHLADDLDNVDLLGTGILDDHVKFGLLFNRFGSGSGRDAATVAGSLVGAAIGSNSAMKRAGYASGYVERTQPVRRCETRYTTHQEQRIDGYDVVYRYNGQKYQTRMPYDPGPRLRVQVNVRPAG